MKMITYARMKLLSDRREFLIRMDGEFIKMARENEGRMKRESMKSLANASNNSQSQPSFVEYKHTPSVSFLNSQIKKLSGHPIT